MYGPGCFAMYSSQLDLVSTFSGAPPVVHASPWVITKSLLSARSRNATSPCTAAASHFFSNAMTSAIVAASAGLGAGTPGGAPPIPGGTPPGTPPGAGRGGTAPG